MRTWTKFSYHTIYCFGFHTVDDEIAITGNEMAISEYMNVVLYIEMG